MASIKSWLPPNVGRMWHLEVKNAGDPKYWWTKAEKNSVLSKMEAAAMDDKKYADRFSPRKFIFKIVVVFVGAYAT